MTYRKVRFTSTARGATAGLVFPQDRLAAMSVGDLSRHWPVWEAPKMRRIQTSPAFATEAEALAHQFEEVSP